MLLFVYVLDCVFGATYVPSNLVTECSIKGGVSLQCGEYFLSHRKPT